MSFHPPSRKATSDGGRRELGEAVQSWFDEVEDFPSSNVDPFRTVLPTGISTCIQKTSQIWHILIFNFFLEGGLFTYCLACKFCHGPTSWQRCLSQAHQGQGDRPLHPGGLGRVNPRRMRLHLQIRRGQAEIPIPGGADGTGGGQEHGQGCHFCYLWNLATLARRRFPCAHFPLSIFTDIPLHTCTYILLSVFFFVVVVCRSLSATTAPRGTSWAGPCTRRRAAGTAGSPRTATTGAETDCASAKHLKNKQQQLYRRKNILCQHCPLLIY